MTKTENLLIVAMEECNEISQELSKMLRFGAYNHHPEDPYTFNVDRIRKEYAQLQAIMEQIDSQYDKNVTDEELKQLGRQKLVSIEQWAEVSRREECIKDI